MKDRWKAFKVWCEGNRGVWELLLGILGFVILLSQTRILERQTSMMERQLAGAIRPDVRLNAYVDSGITIENRGSQVIRNVNLQIVHGAYTRKFGWYGGHPSPAGSWDLSPGQKIDISTRAIVQSGGFALFRPDVIGGLRFVGLLLSFERDIDRKQYLAIYPFAVNPDHTLFPYFFSNHSSLLGSSVTGKLSSLCNYPLEFLFKYLRKWPPNAPVEPYNYQLPTSEEDRCAWSHRP